MCAWWGGGRKRNERMSNCSFFPSLEKYFCFMFMRRPALSLESLSCFFLVFRRHFNFRGKQCVFGRTRSRSEKVTYDTHDMLQDIPVYRCPSAQCAVPCTPRPPTSLSPLGSRPGRRCSHFGDLAAIGPLMCCSVCHGHILWWVSRTHNKN